MRELHRIIAVRHLLTGLALLAGWLAGCAVREATPIGKFALSGAIEQYAATRTDHLVAPIGSGENNRRRTHLVIPSAARNLADRDTNWPYPTFGMFPDWRQDQAASQPTTTQSTAVPEGYWRKDIWHQMGHEALDLGKRDFWRGFKTSFWDLENALALTAAMGASVAIRETGVDHTIRGRVKGHRQFGDLDETIQILSNPGTHFAATGVLWLTSALTKDVKQHELAKTLAQALAVNGATTLLLKGAVNTREPDGGHYAWPSGHTSSAFTVAAVLNEHYGPRVGVPSLALAGLVGYQRIDSREHDLSDVVFGAMLGYVVGTSIARDNQAEFPEIWGMKVVPFADPETGTSGIALMKQW